MYELKDSNLFGSYIYKFIFGPVFKKAFMACMQMNAKKVQA